MGLFLALILERPHTGQYFNMYLSAFLLKPVLNCFSKSGVMQVKLRVWTTRAWAANYFEGIIYLCRQLSYDENVPFSTWCKALRNLHGCLQKHIPKRPTTLLPLWLWCYASSQHSGKTFHNFRNSSFWEDYRARLELFEPATFPHKLYQATLFTIAPILQLMHMLLLKIACT